MVKMRCLECLVNYEIELETLPGEDQDGNPVQLPVKPDVCCPRCYYGLRINEPHPNAR